MLLIWYILPPIMRGCGISCLRLGLLRGLFIWCWYHRVDIEIFHSGSSSSCSGGGCSFWRVDFFFWTYEEGMCESKSGWTTPILFVRSAILV